MLSGLNNNLVCHWENLEYVSASAPPPVSPRSFLLSLGFSSASLSRTLWSNKLLIRRQSEWAEKRGVKRKRGKLCVCAFVCVTEEASEWNLQPGSARQTQALTKSNYPRLLASNPSRQSLHSNKKKKKNPPLLLLCVCFWLFQRTRQFSSAAAAALTDSHSSGRGLPLKHTGKQILSRAVGARTSQQQNTVCLRKSANQSTFGQEVCF